MFTIPGQANWFCDGISRRGFLKVGALGIGGLTLADMFRLEAMAGDSLAGKSIINIYLPGGPTHMDTFDLKPEAPREFRGEFMPISTNVSGMEFCELMPRLASHGDKIALVRSVTDMNNEHSPRQSDSGWQERSLESQGGRPGIGSVMSKVFGPAQTTPHGTAPTFVDMNNWTRPGFLGQVHAGYQPDGYGRQNLQLSNGIDEERFIDRNNLLSGLDRMQRDVDSRHMMDAMDSFSQRAVGIITSGEIARALDIRDVEQTEKERYGIHRDGNNERFLMARRLVEAGVRCVALSWGGCDTHGDNFNSMRDQLPKLDAAISSLIEDLHNVGRLQDTIILMSGEFGRTPRVNGGAGRDHWPQAAFFFLAGGGFKTGQVIGATNRLGEQPIDRPVSLQQVFATIYHQLGIDPESTVLTDPNGRPQYLLDQRQLISELV